MKEILNVTADNLRLWRENGLQTDELRRLQAEQLGRETRTQEGVESALRILWPRKSAQGISGRASEIEEQLAFLRGLLQVHPQESILHALALPELAPAPGAPRVIFLDSMFGREALKCFDKLLPHALPVTAPSFTAVCEELAGDRADFALLPLEDSREGKFLHLYEEIDRFELHITHSCTVTADEGHSVLMALLSRRYAPIGRVAGERVLSCAVLEEDSHALSDLLCAARACNLALRRVDTLPAAYGEDIAIYHPLFFTPDATNELLFLLYLTMFQPRARATARYLHLKGENL